MLQNFKIHVLIFVVAAGLSPATAAELPPAASGPAAAASGPLFLTVPDVIARVKAQNLQLRIQQEGVQRALERVYQRRAALLPQFGLRAEQMRRQIARNQLTGGVLAGTAPFNASAARIEGRMSLIDAQRYADYRISRLSHTIETLDYQVAVQELLDQAIFLYFTQLRDLRSIEILAGNLEREQQLLDLARQQFDAGVAVKIDVTRAEVRLATVKRSLMEAQTAAEDSALQLKNLLDIELEQVLRLDRSLLESIKTPPALKRYGQLTELSEARPEVKSQQTQLEQALLARRATGWQRLPALSLFADWGYDASELSDDDQGEAWMLGVELSLPIWEGGRIAAESREAQAAVRQNELALRELNNAVEREFKFAMLQMDSRYAQIEIARDEVRLGKDEVEQARERYHEGLADNRELIDAQQRLADAENSHLRALYLYRLSRLDFARAIGAVERVLE